MFAELIESQDCHTYHNTSASYILSNSTATNSAITIGIDDACTNNAASSVTPTSLKIALLSRSRYLIGPCDPTTSDIRVQVDYSTAIGFTLNAVPDILKPIMLEAIINTTLVIKEDDNSDPSVSVDKLVPVVLPLWFNAVYEHYNYDTRMALALYNRGAKKGSHEATYSYNFVTSINRYSSLLACHSHPDYYPYLASLGVYSDVNMTQVQKLYEYSQALLPDAYNLVMVNLEARERAMKDRSKTLMSTTSNTTYTEDYHDQQVIAVLLGVRVLSKGDYITRLSTADVLYRLLERVQGAIQCHPQEHYLARYNWKLMIAILEQRGAIYTSQLKWRDALVSYKHMLSLTTQLATNNHTSYSYSKARLALGRVYYHTGSYDDAVSSYEKGLAGVAEVVGKDHIRCDVVLMSQLIVCVYYNIHIYVYYIYYKYILYCNYIVYTF